MCVCVEGDRTRWRDRAGDCYWTAGIPLGQNDTSYDACCMYVPSGGVRRGATQTRRKDPRRQTEGEKGGRRMGAYSVALGVVGWGGIYMKLKPAHGMYPGVSTQIDQERLVVLWRPTEYIHTAAAVVSSEVMDGRSGWYTRARERERECELYDER